MALRNCTALRLWNELLPRADFVILTVPHTPATEGFFDRARFQDMKPTALFINIGRGMTTKLDDLVTALEAGALLVRRWMFTNRSRCRVTIDYGRCRTFC